MLRHFNTQKISLKKCISVTNEPKFCSSANKMEFNVVLPSSLHDPETSHIPTMDVLEQFSDKVTMKYTDSFLIMVTVFLPS